MSREVYEPSEDTELLLRVLREREPELRGLRALEVGPGSGVVARALADAGARVVAVDINPGAVAATRALGIEALRGDLAGAMRGPFDVVVFNAPYLPSSEEERVEGWLDHAFHGGEGGVEVSERFVRDLARLLAPGGRAYLVVSSRADLDRLRSVVQAEGLSAAPAGAARFFFEEISVWRIVRPNHS